MLHVAIGQYVSVKWLFVISCAMKMGYPIQKGLLSTEDPVSAIEKVMLKLRQRYSRPRKLQESEALIKSKAFALQMFEWWLNLTVGRLSSCSVSLA